MKRQLLTLVAVCALFAGSTQAQTTIAEWNFNETAGQTSANVGAGAAHGGLAIVGGGPFAPATAIDAGSQNDASNVMIGGSLNNSYYGRSAPLLVADGGTNPSDQSLRFDTSTAWFEDINFMWDFASGFRANRFFQLQYTTGFTGTGDNASGTTWVNAPAGGVGSTVSVAGVGTGTVSSDGLVEIVIDNGVILPASTAATDYLTDLSYSFPSGFAGENASAFGIRVAAIQDPNGTDFVSSFARTDNTDTMAGYTRTSGDGGGTTRYDLVRITGSVVPEPTGMLPLAAAGLLLLGLVRRRRR